MRRQKRRQKKGKVEKEGKVGEVGKVRKWGKTEMSLKLKCHQNWNVI